MKYKYGTRKCIVCGKDFEAQYPQQITCSPECKNRRKNYIKGESVKRVKARNLALIEGLKSQNEGLKEKVDELLARLAEKKPEKQVPPVDDAALNQMKGQIEKLKAENAELLSQNESFFLAKKALEREVEQLKNELALKKHDDELPKAQWCERLKLKALNLPCGARRQCFEPIPCDRAPAKKGADYVDD